MTFLPEGIHFDVPAALYHADPCDRPSLSSSIAKVLLKDTPRHAWTAHPRLNPAFEAEADSKFDLGSVVHELFLGKGGGYVVGDFADWRSNGAKLFRETARVDGHVPILGEQYDRALAVTKAIAERCQPMIGDLQASTETVIIWQDMGGALCRSMIDLLDSESVLYDLKTTERGLSDAAVTRTICNLGYDLSAAFYIRGLTALRPDLAGRFKFRWIFAEIEEPFEVRIIEADPMTLAFGDRKAALAIEKWRRCMETGLWPGYPAQIERLEYPNWAERDVLARECVDPDAERMIVLPTTPLGPAGSKPLMPPI